MTHPVLKPMTITITPEMVMAAAQKIADKNDSAWQYSEAQILAAVEHYLRCKVKDVLVDADWHAINDRFDFDRTCDHPTCLAKPAPHGLYCSEHSLYSASPDEATEVIVPPAPQWATQEIFPAVQ